MEVIKVADYRPTMTNKSGKGAQEGVQPQGEELSTKGATLSSASLGQDFGRGEVGECGITIKEVGSTPIHGFNPRKEVWEVRLDEGHKLISRDRIKGMSHVQGDINIGGM